jgi:hypothetical protein
VFVTSTVMNANFGGVTGADAICQMRASAAGLRGTFRAWVSDSTSSAASRLVHHTGPYYRVDGTTVRVLSNDWADLTDTIAVAFATDEFGVTQGNQMVWTATDFTGAYTGASCSNWTSTSAALTTTVGNSSAGSTTWTAWNTAYACNLAARLFCLEQ